MVQVDDMMLGACESEFLIGEGFLHSKAVVMNFMTGEVMYYGSEGELVVLPFRGIKDEEHSARVLESISDTSENGDREARSVETRRFCG